MNRALRTLAEHLAIHERLVIIQTLALHNYSRKKTAEVLGIDRKRLWLRIKELKIEVPRTTRGRPRKKPLT